MSSKIFEALGSLDLLEKYKSKFEEHDVDDWVVEKWLQNSSLNELRLVIANAGDRMRFFTAFQQLLSNSSIPGTENPVPEFDRKEKAALYFLKKEFKPHFEILRSRKYFAYVDPQAEVDKIKAKLDSFFLAFSTPQDAVVKVEVEFWKKSTALQLLSNENNQRRLDAENHIKKLYLDLLKSEFQRLKQAVEKHFPKPFYWANDLDRLHRHFNPFLKGLVTPKSPAYDLGFQKMCHETCCENIKELCGITKFSFAVFRAYSLQMQHEFGENLCINLESEFTHLYDAILSGRLFYELGDTDVETVTHWIITPSGIIDYFDKQASQVSETVETFKISQFHKAVCDVVRKSFDVFLIRHFNDAMFWMTWWGEIEEHLKHLEKDNTLGGMLIS